MTPGLMVEGSSEPAYRAPQETRASYTPSYTTSFFDQLTGCEMLYGGVALFGYQMGNDFALYLGIIGIVAETLIRRTEHRNEISGLQRRIAELEEESGSSESTP